MPYIAKNERKFFDEHLEKLIELIDEPGHLCYCIYFLMKRICEENPRFAIMSTLISELECAKLEFYRRVVAPYEDTKIIKNGDIK